MAESRSAERVREALRANGLDDTVREMPDSTRTAEEAAAAVGCEVAQIVKSLLFVREDGHPTLVLTSGRNRVDAVRLAAEVGAELHLADPATVRDLTGFAIGGVAPLGLATEIPVVLDRDLLDHAQVWAAAGAPRTVFPVAPEDLRRVTNARVATVTGPSPEGTA